MRMRASFVISAGLVMAASLTLAGPALARPDAAGTTWGEVVTLADRSFENLSTLTTDNGLVVAAWSGRSFSNLFIAVRPSGGGWSTPTKIVGHVAAVNLAKDGKGAWLVYQGFESVSALRVAKDGTVGTPAVLGPSSDPFVAGAQISVGANGAVAAVWHQQTSAAMLSYRPAGGQWGQVEDVPITGYLQGLVVGSAGAAQLIQQSGTSLTYLRRSANGAWGNGLTVSSVANLPTVAGNAQGDLVVGWEIVNGDGTLSLGARYRAAGSGFDATEHIADGVPYGTSVALAMANSGAVAAAYRTTDVGTKQIQLTPTDAGGAWLDPQDLSLTGSSYDVTTNSAGDFVVTSMLGKGVQVSRCPAGGTCDAAEVNRATRFRFPSTTLGPHGTVTMVWGRGCKTEECVPSRLVAQRGR